MQHQTTSKRMFLLSLLGSLVLFSHTSNKHSRNKSEGKLQTSWKINTVVQMFRTKAMDILKQLSDSFSNTCRLYYYILQWNKEHKIKRIQSAAIDIRQKVCKWDFNIRHIMTASSSPCGPLGRSMTMSLCGSLWPHERPQDSFQNYIYIAVTL